MAINNLVKRIQDIMRNDAGVDGDAQRISQMTWMYFLKVYDAKEEEWEMLDENYKSLIPNELKWRNWAVDDHSNNVITGDTLLNFINNILFPFFKGREIDLNYKKYRFEITPETPLKQRIVQYVFEDASNYMKDGVLLRQVINVINEVDFSEYKERHEFGNIYETILKSLQSAGNAGEFYTPRAVTDFMVKMIGPKLGESVADFACGTGGFLTSALKYLEPQRKSEEDVDKYNNAVYGIEKKPLPYLLCITNMLLHDVDEPKIYHMNSLEKNVRDYKEADKFDIILMNPPYGGSEKDVIKNNFPVELRSSDIRMPHSVFAPYTSITTNILFFENTHPTEETWIYRMDMPEGYKNFSKTKPILLEHFNPVIEWWNNREEITIDSFPKAKKYTKKELEDNHYNLDLCGYPHEEEEILDPHDLIKQFREKRAAYNAEMEETLDKILELLDEDN